MTLKQKMHSQDILMREFYQSFKKLLTLQAEPATLLVVSQRPFLVGIIKHIHTVQQNMSSVESRAQLGRVEQWM